MHDNRKYPNLKAIEFCVTCSIGMCYTCGNDHIDKNHQVDWGFDIFDKLELSKDEVNDVFNSGHRVLLDWEQLYCPCWTKITS